jgi:hypothetical protein
MRRTVMTANTNCLEGLQCPKCKSYGPFDIEVVSTARIHDDGVEEYTGADFDEGSVCVCVNCKFVGGVTDLRVEDDSTKVWMDLNPTEAEYVQGAEGNSTCQLTFYDDQGRLCGAVGANLTEAAVNAKEGRYYLVGEEGIWLTEYVGEKTDG